MSIVTHPDHVYGCSGSTTSAIKVSPDIIKIPIISVKSMWVDAAVYNKDIVCHNDM